MPSKKRTAPLTESQEVDLEIVIPKIEDVFKEILTFVPEEQQGKIH